MDTEKNLWDKLDTLYGEINNVLEELSCRQPPTGKGGEATDGLKRFGCSLRREIQRSQRYNHYCVAAMVPVTRKGPSGIMQAALACFRETDVLNLLEGDAGGNDGCAAEKPVYLAVLMPETQREGGHVAVRRAMSILQTDAGKYGLAVYPDDATNASDLLHCAMAGLK